jgi:hypothetical protein
LATSGSFLGSSPRTGSSRLDRFAVEHLRMTDLFSARPSGAG